MNTRFKVLASYNILRYLYDLIHVLIFVTVSKCRKSLKLTNIVIKVAVGICLVIRCKLQLESREANLEVQKVISVYIDFYMYKWKWKHTGSFLTKSVFTADIIEDGNKSAAILYFK